MRLNFPHGIVNDLDEDGSSRESIDEWGSVVGSGQDGSWSKSMAVCDGGSSVSNSWSGKKSTISNGEESDKSESDKLKKGRDNY